MGWSPSVIARRARHRGVSSVLSGRPSPRMVRRHEACGRGRPRWVLPIRRPPSPSPPTGWGFRRFCRVSGAEHRPAQPGGSPPLPPGRARRGDPSGGTRAHFLGGSQAAPTPRRASAASALREPRAAPRSTVAPRSGRAGRLLGPSGRCDPRRGRNRIPAGVRPPKTCHEVPLAAKTSPEPDAPPAGRDNRRLGPVLPLRQRRPRTRFGPVSPGSSPRWAGPSSDPGQPGVHRRARGARQCIPVTTIPSLAGAAGWSRVDGDKCAQERRAAKILRVLRSITPKRASKRARRTTMALMRRPRSAAAG
jgi:hypothetical protein